MWTLLLFGLLVQISFVRSANETTCEPLPTQKDTTRILANLRAEMRKDGIGVYVVFSDDEHGSEYTQPYDKRRDWITGFQGSTGTAVITLDAAALWVDSRYFTQAEEELDCKNWFLMRDGSPGVPSIVNWIVSEANKTDRVSRCSFFCDKTFDSSLAIGHDAGFHPGKLVVHGEQRLESDRKRTYSGR